MGFNSYIVNNRGNEQGVHGLMNRPVAKEEIYLIENIIAGRKVKRYTFLLQTTASNHFSKHVFPAASMEQSRPEKSLGRRCWH